MLKVGSRPFLNVLPPPLQGGEGVQSLRGKKGCLSGPARAESPLPPIFPFEQWRLMGRERGSHGWNKAAGLEPPPRGGGCRRSCETLHLGDRNTERLANGETFAPLSGRRQDCDRPRLCSGFRGRCSCSPTNFFKTSVKEITEEIRHNEIHTPNAILIKRFNVPLCEPIPQNKHTAEQRRARRTNGVKMRECMANARRV